MSARRIRGASRFSAIFDRLTRDVGEETKRRYHADWMRLYRRIDIMDTGLNDCRRPDYRAVVQADADWLGASLGYVPGGTHLLEKLFSGRWDGQFLVLKKGTRTNREQILI